jgi:hypothetical protein
MVKEVNGGNNSIDSENTNPNKSVVHIHFEFSLEHNLVGYAKYYSYGHKNFMK